MQEYDDLKSEMENLNILNLKIKQRLILCGLLQE